MRALLRGLVGLSGELRLPAAILLAFAAGLAHFSLWYEWMGSDGPPFSMYLAKTVVQYVIVAAIVGFLAFDHWYVLIGVGWFVVAITIFEAIAGSVSPFSFWLGAIGIGGFLGVRLGHRAEALLGRKGFDWG